MKKALLISLILSLVLLTTGCKDEAVKGAPVLTVFTATDLEGNLINESVLTNAKITMVNIWATFCSPCIREMPELAELNNSYGDDFQVIGIVIDAADENGIPFSKQYAEALSIIQKTGADYLHLLPSPTLTNAYLGKVQAVPETIFVDNTGHQIGKSYVGAKNLAEWKQIVEDLLHSKSS